MSAELIHALEQLEREKGIEKEVLIGAIEAAIISAYKKNFGQGMEIKIDFDRHTGQVRVFAVKTVVKKVEDDMIEMTLKEAKEIDDSYKIDDVVEIEVTPRKFGRIAAQTAKQVVMQRIREAERGIIFEEFYDKEDDIVTGIVQRTERRNIIVDLGRTEGMLLYQEQVPSENYMFNERLKCYVTEVKNTSKGPSILLSRTHPGLVKRLFELEVPEIFEGIVEIKSISREAGSRTKIAVFSTDDDIDPVGACVGQKGTRVQAIVDELRGEKIDIIKWSASPEEFISGSLSPAKVIRVDINEEDKEARVTVPDYQLSLAIGKEGQNARLAAKLTGWKIDIKNETQLRQSIEEQLLNFDDEDYDYEDDEEYDAEFYDGGKSNEIDDINNLWRDDMDEYDHDEEIDEDYEEADDVQGEIVEETSETGEEETEDIESDDEKKE
jgi:N utilization substance protein A